MDELQNAITTIIGAVQNASSDFFTSVWFPIQLGVIVLIAMLGICVSLLVRHRVDITAHTMGWPPRIRLLVRAVLANLATLVFAIVAGLTRSYLVETTWPSRSYLIGVAASLAAAWFIIGVATSLIRNKLVHRLVAITAWTFATLSILGLLGAAENLLDSIWLPLGGLRISPLFVFKTLVLLLIAMWIAVSFGNFLDIRLHRMSDLTLSMQELLSKLARITLIVVAVLVVANSAGIDLSAFALFSGAVGVGVGFGLQKIVSNLVSGLILLADKSIKPGDFISVGDSVGAVTTMGARYTSIDTKDGREFLVPNEDFVTQRVVNLSYSNNELLLEVTFGVSYASDPHKVRDLALETAKSVPRVLSSPAPLCYLMAFGPSSLDFSLRFWIADPGNGMRNVRSAVMLALWDTFQREKIEIPYPISELRLAHPVPVTLGRHGAVVMPETPSTN